MNLFSIHVSRDHVSQVKLTRRAGDILQRALELTASMAEVGGSQYADLAEKARDHIRKLIDQIEADKTEQVEV